MCSVPLLLVKGARTQNTRIVILLVYEIAEGAALNVVHYDTVPVDIDVANEWGFDPRLQTAGHASRFLHTHSTEPILPARGACYGCLHPGWDDDTLFGLSPSRAPASPRTRP